MNRIGFIGTGHIAAPMARALARDGHQVAVSHRNALVSAELVAAGLGIKTAPNQQVIDTADIVFLCLRPAVWREVVADTKWRTDHKVVSVMGGVSLGDIADICAPVTNISATIPYGFLESGGCPMPVAGDPAVVRELFGAANIVLPQTDEAALQHHFAASSLASGVLDFMDNAAGWLADKTGDPDKAEIYVANLISGILHNLEKSKAGVLAGERDALATPNTLNLQMVEGLNAAHAFDSLPAIMDKISASMDK